MMNICLVVNGINYGGVEKVIENYLLSYDKTKYKFSIITQKPSSAENKKIFSDAGFTIYEVTHKRVNLFLNIREIIKILKSNKFDIIHSHMSFTNFYVLFIAQILGISVRINHYHNVFNNKGIKKIVVDMCNKLNDFFSTCNIYCSDAVANYLNKSRKKSYILYNTIDTEKFKFDLKNRETIRKYYNIYKNVHVIGHVGRYSKQKNQLFILKIFKEYSKLDEKAVLLLCGDGEDRNIIEKYIFDNNLLEKVIMVGNTNCPEILYSAMDVFLFPSVYEGLGLTFLEAQLNGMPCLGSSILPNEVVVSENVMLLPLNDSTDVWVNALAELIKNRNNHVLEEKVSRYRLDKHRSDLFDIYDRLMR